MKTYLECWSSIAKSLFSQALAGGPDVAEVPEIGSGLRGPAFIAEISGDVAGSFTVVLDPQILDAPLLGDGIDQAGAWKELLREVAEAAAGELLVSSQLKCQIDSFGPCRWDREVSRSFRLISSEHSWHILVHDGIRSLDREVESSTAMRSANDQRAWQQTPGADLLLDVELEASLRFGCREMPLGEILELGPGDVVELDRHVSDPVDLIVGDKIVARGDVVLVNGNFGLRVTEVATPRKRLENIRCLF